MAEKEAADLGRGVQALKLIDHVVEGSFGTMGKKLDNVKKSGAQQVGKVWGAIKGWWPAQQSAADGRPSQTEGQPVQEEGGMLFAKNNVMYKTTDLRKIPGYLFIRGRETVVYGVVLLLNWVPNTNLVEQCEPTMGAVSLDLSKMEAIHVFFEGSSEEQYDSGQVIVREANDSVHVFHFVSGGLQQLFKVLRQCPYYEESVGKEGGRSCVFTVSHARLGRLEGHPEEAEFRSMLTPHKWHQLLDQSGAVLDPDLVQKIIFFKGMSAECRVQVWPFLLHVYSWQSTLQQREQKRQELDKRFEELQAKVLMEAVFLEESALPASVTAMDKDISRADLSSQQFNGDKADIRENLRTIVLCYLSLNPHVSYCQGMTDLALPLLAVLPDLSLVFWCFVQVMEHSLLVGPDTAAAMKKETEAIVSLVQCLVPCFHDYLDLIDGGLDLLFCHRWLFVCFKREFSIEDIVQLWEVCWACQESNYFHLLVAVAIIAMYGDKAIEQEMPSDSLMIHFAGLAHSMPVEVVLSQARGLLHTLNTSESVLPPPVTDLLHCNLQHNEGVTYPEPPSNEHV